MLLTLRLTRAYCVFLCLLCYKGSSYAWHCLHRHKRTIQKHINNILQNRSPFVDVKFAIAILGQVFQLPLETRPAVVATQEGPASDDDSYMGYSVAVGDFYGDNVQGAAVGMPRGAGLEGKVS